MLERNELWRDIKTTIAQGQTAPWSKSVLQRLEHACVRGNLCRDEWADFLRTKLTQLSRRHGFGVNYDNGILILCSMQSRHKFIQINFDLKRFKCHVMFCDEEICECFHTTQLMGNQQWVEIRRKLMLIFSLFMPNQTPQQLQNKYLKLKESEQRCNVLFNVSKRNGLSFMEIPVYQSLYATITMTPSDYHSNSLMLRLSEPIMINQRSLDLVSCQLIDDSTRTITESEKFDLKKLQVLTKQTNSIRFTSAIQFDQALNIGTIIDVLWVWKRISLLVKSWKMNNTTFIYISKHGVIQSSSNGCSIEVSLCKNGSTKVFPSKVLSAQNFENIHNCLSKDNLNSFECVFAAATTEYVKNRAKYNDTRRVLPSSDFKSVLDSRNDDNSTKHPHLIKILKDAQTLKSKDSSDQLKFNESGVKRSSSTETGAPSAKLAK